MTTPHRTLREAAQMALDALTNCLSEHGHRCNRCDSEIDEGGKLSTALREALAAPEPLTSDQEKALSAEAKTGPFQHTTPSYGNDMQSGETPRLSGNRHAGSTPPAAPAPAAPVPDGCVMVPREPTPEMIAAMPYPANTIPAVGVACYRAMIAASPAAPAAPVVPLTDEQIALAIFEARVGHSPFKRDGSTSFRIARAAIAKFCEVNGIGGSNGNV